MPTAVHREDRARSGRPVLYRLHCPSRCGLLASGTGEAARLVREHPAACPDPGPVWPGSTLHPLVYAEPTR